MTVSKCSARFVPLRAILPLQDKTSHALQLQPCFTEHKSGCVFQVTKTFLWFQTWMYIYSYFTPQKNEMHHPWFN